MICGYHTATRKDSAVAHQDQGRGSAQPSGAEELFEALKWLTVGADWSGLPFRRECTWLPWQLVYGAILWAWSDESTLTDRFRTARKVMCRLAEQQEQPLATSYQAFLKLLGTWTARLRDKLVTCFRQRMRVSLAELWTVAGWIVMACDGSQIGLPRTRGNEARYSPRSKLARAAQKRRAGRRKRRTLQQARQRKANVPGIWLTMLWHVGSGLPWDWRAGPADSSEREHLRQMLGDLPRSSLVTIDAGFVGYDLWKTMLDAGHQFLVRVGRHVRLLRRLGYVRERQGMVYLWPDQAARRRHPPLVLRLIVIHETRHPVYLVTSVTDPRQLSDSTAARIYRRRWGIELFYRHCKQTFERAKLRSKNPDNAMLELHWSLLGQWAMGVHSHYHLRRRGVPPDRVSFARVLRAYRRCLREYKSPPDPGDRLQDRLSRAVIDDYPRINKASRDYVRKKQHKPPGPPIIHSASKQQIEQAKRLRQKRLKRLTA